MLPPDGSRAGWLPDVAVPDASNDALTTVGSALAELTGSPTAPLLLAVSGGPDSMAMLDIVCRSWAGQVFAATVDHRLRPESADEAAMVAGYCAGIGVPHAILYPDGPITGSIQSAARAVRYRLLEQESVRCGATSIVTAHHADDQLETVLMRLGRGSGVDGLAGVRVRNGQVVRPLLGLRKADLVRHCAIHAIPFVNDPSNANTDFDRVRMRKAIEGLELIDPLQAARSAAALAEAVDALDWIVSSEAQTAIISASGTIMLTRTDYPAAVLRRLVLRCLEGVQPGIAPRGDALGRVIEALRRREQAMIGDVLCKGGDVWRFAGAPPRHSARNPGSATE